MPNYECGIRFTMGSLQEAGTGSKATGYLTCSAVECPLAVNYKYVSSFTEGAGLQTAVKLPQFEVLEKARKEVKDNCLISRSGREVTNDVLPKELKEIIPKPLQFFES